MKMRGDINLLAQLVNSMSDAVVMLEQAKNENRLEDFKKMKNFILIQQQYQKISGNILL